MVCVVSVARVAINAVKEARKGGACTHNWELYKSGIKPGISAPSAVNLNNVSTCTTCLSLRMSLSLGTTLRRRAIDGRRVVDGRR